MSVLLRKYGTATTIIFPLLDAATDDLLDTGTIAAGDIKIMKDEGAIANTTNVFTDEDNGYYALSLTATEMQAARIAIRVVDQTTPKLWRDQTILIETYGHASAQHPTLMKDTYQAKAGLVDDDSAGTPTDRYIVEWFKNGEPITSGITSPTIQVVDVSDGSDLIASSAMTEIASLGMYRYDATTTERIADGAAYIIIASATIDGATRTWNQHIGRDS